MTQTPAPPIQPWRTPWPWLALLLGLALTFSTWGTVRKVDAARLRELESAQADQMAEKMAGRLGDLEQVLHGAAGFLGRGPLPSRSEWRSYVQGLRLDQSYPGIQALSFVEWVPREELSRHGQRVRAEGFPDYRISPGGPLEALPEGVSSILYIEPMDAQNLRAFGRDMLADPIRRPAMLKSRDSGLASLTGPVTLYQSGVGEPLSGCILYVPVYRQGLPLDTVLQRRAALRGWASSPVRIARMLEAVLAHELRTMDLEVRDADGGRQGLLHDSDPEHPAQEKARSLVRTVQAVDRSWVARVHANQAFDSAAGASRHLALLAGGLVASGLLCALVLTLLSAENRARHLAEARGEELLANESRFRALFEKAPLGMAMVDSASGRFLSVNLRYAQMLGYTVAEMNGRTFQSLTHPEHVADDVASVQQLVSGEIREYAKEKRYLHRDGHEVWARIGVVALPVVPGEPLRHLALVEDITEARARESALRESEARFRAIFDAVPDPMTLTRLTDGKIVLANPAWCDTIGFRLEEVIGKDTLELGIWPRPEQRRALLERVQKGEELGAEVLDLRARDGRILKTLITGRVLPTEEGERLGMFIGRDVTERLRAEQALQESELRFRTLAEQAQDLVYRYQFTPDPGFAYVSPSCTVINGYTPEEHYADPLLGRKIVHPEDLPLIDATLDERREVEGPLRLRWIRKDGRVIWIEQLVTFLHGSDGRRTAVQGTVREVTAQVEAEQAVRLREERLRLIGDQLQDAFVYQLRQDPQEGRRFLYVSEGVSRVCGVSPESVLADPMVLFDQIDPGQAEDYLAGETGSAATLSPFSMDLHIQRGDGSPRWIHVSSTPRRLPDGGVVWDGLAADTTLQKEAQLALEESEARFRQVFEQAADAIFLHDASGRVRLANPAACRSLGYTAEELARMTVRDIDIQARDEKDGVLWHGLRLGQQAQFMGLHRRKNGDCFQVEVHLGVLSEGPERLLLAVVRDLEQVAQAKEAELRARKAESLVLMASGIAHDFNNLFQVIQSNLDLVGLKIEGDESAAKAVGQAQRTLNRAVALSWKMLDISGGGLVRLERLELGRWLVAATAELQAGLPAGFRIDLSCEPVPAVQADPRKLQEVLMSLVDNALEAAAEGKGRLRVRLYPDFGARTAEVPPGGVWPLPPPRVGGLVCLELADDGPGVPPDRLGLICDPFFTTREPGRGLGLAAAVGLLRAHRAGLQLERGEPTGLTVRLCFPPSGA